MNHTLAPVRVLDSDRLTLSAVSADGTRLALIDRVELRLGLWLLLRSARRHDAARDRAAHRRLTADSRSLGDRHHAALRVHALNGVRT